MDDFLRLKAWYLLPKLQDSSMENLIQGILNDSSSFPKLLKEVPSIISVEG